jgi:hypothetical protein
MNESPDLWNVTVDERGGITKRLGFVKWNASAAANLITYGYYSLVADKMQWYSQADGKLYYDNGTGVLTLGRTWTSGFPITIVRLRRDRLRRASGGRLFTSHERHILVAVTAASGLVPKGYLLAVWQNKLWVAGDPAATTRCTSRRRVMPRSGTPLTGPASTISVRAGMVTPRSWPVRRDRLRLPDQPEPACVQAALRPPRNRRLHRRLHHHRRRSRRSRAERCHDRLRAHLHGVGARDLRDGRAVAR